MRRAVTGQFDLDLAASEAIGMFTPEGERGWVPGWDPRYPAGDASESPGTVFTTDAHAMDTIWVVNGIDRAACAVAYTRVTPGHHAGTVHVSCSDVEEGRCRVTVSYDMSPLPGGATHELDAYQGEAFEAMLDHWSKALSQR